MFSRLLADGTTYEQERTVTDYNGNFRIAIVDAPWDSEYLPGYGTDTVSVFTAADLRPTINPAMQVLDYLKSKRYGKGLKDSDIDLDSFKSVAAACDTQSDVSVVVETANLSSIAKNDVYKYGTLNSDTNYFQGQVSEIGVSRTIDSTAYTQITFTNVIGKL